jgi:F-type H+-transporting ATPase subunit b
MPQLDATFYVTQLFWLAIVFIAIYSFMSFFFVPRIGKIVEARESKVKTDIEAAEKMLTEQRLLKKEIEKLLDEARTIGGDIKKKAAKESENELNQMISTFEKQLSKKVAKEEEKLSRVKNQLLSEIDGIASQLSDVIYKAIIDTKKSKSN